MCGIAGIFNPQEKLPDFSADVLTKMASIQAHRGPDDSGIFLSEHCGFSFRRLSIIDLESGHQPMFSSSGNLVIVFNGEIYNFHELKNDLQARGAIFRTDSDTEVILQGYEFWGEAVLDKLRGMFAFAIYNIKKKELFIARDHTGIKPFYYCWLNNILIFASEIKAILKFPGVISSINLKMLPRFISFLWVPAPDTMFENIFVLEPAHLMRVSNNGIVKKRYWYPQINQYDYNHTEEEWIELVIHELYRTVKEQMISDVPIGAFLSGGVDSTTIVAYANLINSQPITTYTTGFRSGDLSRDIVHSDLEYARFASRHLKVDYNEIILTSNITEILPRLVWHMDEPIADPAAVNTYLICKAAKEKATVMLSGVGGDEIFGGYPRYLADKIARIYNFIPNFLQWPFNYFFANILPVGNSSFLRNVKKFLKSANLPFIERYYGFLSYYSKNELKNLLKVDFTWEDIFGIHNQIILENDTKDVLQWMMNLDLKTFLPYLNLMYTDKMSSAASIEVRVPLLDHILIEKVAKIPSSYKINRFKRKYIFKKVAEKYLPREIVWRKKVGFGAPIGSWINEQLKEMIYDLLSEYTIKKRNYFNYAFVSSLVDDHMTGKAYNANQIWQLMTLELWHQEFIDN